MKENENKEPSSTAGAAKGGDTNNKVMGSAVSTAVGEPVATAVSAAKPVGSIGDYAQFHTLLQACYEACEVLDKATGRDVLDAADKLTDAQNRLVEYINTSSARLAAPTQVSAPQADEAQINRIVAYWEDQARRGCVDAFKCALKEAFAVGAAQEVRAVPDDVHRALDRMCTPLDESRLSGATAAEDARCMQIIRRYVESTSTAPAAMDEGKWISVDERLPEIDYTKPEFSRYVRVLAAWGDKPGQLAEMRYASNGYAKTEKGQLPRFEWQGKISPWPVTHWMPLPAAPASQPSLDEVTGAGKGEGDA